MESFVFESTPARIVFGAGSLAKLGEEIAHLQCSRALFLSTPGRADVAQRAADSVGSLSVSLHAKAAMHVPIEIVGEACSVADTTKADCLVTIGGGSAIGLGKAMAVHTGLSIIAIPTTFAGSEMTAVWGQTENAVKRTTKDPVVRPKTVIYDSILLAGLPMSIAAPSAMNAMAHSVEAMYSVNSNPVVALYGKEAITVLCEALPELASGKQFLRPGALARAQYGCWLASLALSSSSISLHHKLCHTLGGTLGLSHAQTHSVILPYATEYNANAAPEAMVAIAMALKEYGRDGAALGLQRFAQAIGAPSSLKQLGVERKSLGRIADLVLTNPYPNPREIDRDAVLDLLERALEGAPPEADPL